MVYFWWHSRMKWNDVITSQSGLRLVRSMPLSFDVDTCNFSPDFFLQEFERLTAKISSVWIQINFRRKNISKIRRNSNRPWENSSRKYQSHISSVLSIKKCIVKQLLKSVFSCYHKLSNLVSDEPLSNQALRFFFFDRPRQRMLQRVICLPNGYQRYNVGFFFLQIPWSFYPHLRGHASLFDCRSWRQWKMRHQGWAREKDI